LTKANYVQFSKIHDALNSQGLKILAFPCNQFGAQEPGTHEEILDFVETKFGAKDKFIWFEKGHVNGAKTREVYSFLKENLPSDDGTKDIRWNFAKFLIDHEGNPVKRYGPKTNPNDMVPDIEELLGKRNAK
jgi:glutathione peroxidase